MDNIEIEKKLKDRMPYKWRVQSSRASGCICVAYIDARQVMDRLDEVVGPNRWQDDYYSVGIQTYCKIGIDYGIGNGGTQGMVWKSDSGAESNIEKEKGLASDCFKRAAVKHGIGRFLYTMDIVWLPTWKTTDYNGKDVYKPLHDQSRGVCPPNLLIKSKEGKASLLINEYKLTEYINDVLKR